MKKVNKIMMATVAILLSLVLISTSLVSGIFAKFVIKKEVGVPIKFKNFGVTMQVKHNGVKIEESANTVSITYDNLTAMNLYPGMAEKGDAIVVAFTTASGGLSFATDLKIRIDVDFRLRIV